MGSVLGATFVGLFAAAVAGQDVGAFRARGEGSYGKLPLVFEANQGQTDRRVEFLSRGNGYTLFLTPGEAVLSLKRADQAAGEAVLRMTLVGANRAARARGLSPLLGRSHYLIGNDPAAWRKDVPQYARVGYRDVYPGVDLVYYGHDRELEYDFVVTRRADPARIRLRFSGIESLEVDRRGDLILRMADGKVISRHPVLYQEVDGLRKAVSGRYRRHGDREVGFRVDAYDRERPLVIDPVLGYSTYLGGSGLDQGFAIAVDSAGSAYVTGQTTSTNFPTTNAAFDRTSNGSTDAFVTKLNASGSAVVYSTYLGGSGMDRGLAVAVDSSRHAYVTGFTTSPDFPTTAGVLEPTGSFGGFVTKLNPAGSAADYSTYLSKQSGFGIAVDGSGNAYVAGTGNFHAAITKLKADGTATLYETTLAGNANEDAYAIALDASNNAYVTGVTASTDFPTTAGIFQKVNRGGADAFVTKLDTAGALVYSTYLGGNRRDIGFAIAVDASGNAYVTGQTESTDLPTTAGAFQMNGGDTNLLGSSDAFVAKVNAVGSALVYCTYLGGSGGTDFANGIAVDASGKAYVSGSAFASDFPTLNSFQAAQVVGHVNGFVSKLNAAGSALSYSTFIGAAGLRQTMALDASANVYVTGDAQSTTFPTTAGAFQKVHHGGGPDAFVMRINAADGAKVAAGATDTVSTAPAMAGDAGVSATLTNNTTGSADAMITAENLASAPATAGIIDVGGRYVDLRVRGADATDVVTAKFYYPSTVTGTNEVNLQLLYFTAASSWAAVLSSGGVAPVKDTTDNLDGTVSGGRFAVTFDDTSTPKVTELTGTVFTAALLVAQPPINHDPVASCRNVTVPTAPGACQAGAASVDNGSYDPDGDPITRTQDPPGPYARGATSVRLTVADNRGGSDSCLATVSIEDHEAPAIACPAPLVLECSSPAGAPASPTATASDNCDAVAAACSPSGVFRLGSTGVTCSATDSSGNTGSCQTSVTVVDTKAPAVQCAPAGKLFRVSAQDLCSTPTIRIGSYALAEGETIKITQSRRASGVTLVGASGHSRIKHFRVGQGQAVIVATDPSGNAGKAVCPLPARGMDDDDDRDDEREDGRRDGSGKGAGSRK